MIFESPIEREIERVATQLHAECCGEDCSHSPFSAGWWAWAEDIVSGKVSYEDAAARISDSEGDPR